MTAVSGDELTVERGSEGTTASAKNTSGSTYYMQRAPTKRLIQQLRSTLDKIFSDTDPAYGATGDGTTDDTAAIILAKDACSGSGSIYFPPGTYRVTSDLTFASGENVIFENGAQLSIDSGVTVTFVGNIQAPPANIFSGAGSVIISSGTALAYPAWWANLTGTASRTTSSIESTDIRAVGDGISGDYSVQFRVGGTPENPAGSAYAMQIKSTMRPDTDGGHGGDATGLFVQTFADVQENNTYPGMDHKHIQGLYVETPRMILTGADTEIIQQYKACHFEHNKSVKVPIGAITNGPFQYNELILCDRLTYPAGGYYPTALEETADGMPYLHFKGVVAGEWVFKTGDTLTGATSGATATVTGAPSLTARHSMCCIFAHGWNAFTNSPIVMGGAGGGFPVYPSGWNNNYNTVFRIDNHYIAPSTGSDSAVFDIRTQKYIKADSGTHDYIDTVRLEPPEVYSGSATITNFSTLRITSAPTGGTKNRALLIEAGDVEIADNLEVAGTLEVAGNTIGPAWQVTDGWYQNAVAASQSAVKLDRDSTASASCLPEFFIPVRAGSVTGIAVKGDASVTAGSITVEVRLGGSPTGLTATLDTSTANNYDSTTQSPGITTYSKKESIEKYITTSSDLTPTTINIRAMVEIVT